MTDDLKTAWEKAEQRAQKLMAEKDEAKAKYREQLQEANQQAADAQKAYLDAEAANALLDRPDGEVLAQALGLELPGAGE